MSIKSDVEVLKSQIADIRQWQQSADENHFPSIERRFDKIETKIAYWSGGLAVLITGLQIIFKYIL